ncbi:alpha/beta hydrolase fold-domain-containing protein [Sporodiniella umbellata]|nr:alpha/beta hydrolase fold-domain-containing protein [Sporodiniella umbellata]
MSIAPPVPLGEATIQSLSLALGVSKEDAVKLENYRLFYDAIFFYHELDKEYRKDSIIEYEGQKIKISIIKPKEHNNQVLPVILYIHGGGWILGDIKCYNKQLHEATNCAKAYIVFPYYSLSPEVKYPVALEECYTTLQWIQKSGETLKFDTSRLAVAGDSAGGNLAAALTILSKRRENKGIKQQVLYYPITDNNFETESYQQYKDNRFLNANTLKYMWNMYARHEDDFKYPLLAPLKATQEDLEGLPPALVIAAEMDPLRTESELYARKLQKANVETVSVRYNGVEHGFVTTSTPAISPEGIQAIQQTSEWLKDKWFLESV